jgi:hypothetical protein
VALDSTIMDSSESEKPIDKKVESAYNDPERQGSTGRRFSRVGSDGSALSVGAQIELEKENAIQYRTCGWKKVR